MAGMGWVSMEGNDASGVMEVFTGRCYGLYPGK